MQVNNVNNHHKKSYLCLRTDISDIKKLGAKGADAIVANSPNRLILKVEKQT